MAQAAVSAGGNPCFFDIVNGFLIDAVAHRVWFCGREFTGLGAYAALTIVEFGECQIWQMLHLAEINRPHLVQRNLYAGLLLMVWILKREVRAFGGCLGMYRR